MFYSVSVVLAGSAIILTITAGSEILGALQQPIRATQYLVDQGRVADVARHHSHGSVARLLHDGTLGGSVDGGQSR